MTNRQFLQEKVAMLTGVLNCLSDAEGFLDSLEKIEVSMAEEPDHDALAVADLVADAYESCEALRNSIEAQLEVGESQ